MTSRNEIDGVMMLAMDITERKQAAEALRQSEAELRALFGAMTDVIFVLDSDGRYLKVAPTGEQLLAGTPDQVVGRTIYDLLPHDEAARYHDFIQLALDTRQPIKVEYSLPVKGQNYWFVATISPMLEDHGGMGGTRHYRAQAFRGNAGGAVPHRGYDCRRSRHARVLYGHPSRCRRVDVCGELLTSRSMIATWIC